MPADKVYFEAEFDSDDGGETPTAVRLDKVLSLTQNLTGRRLYNPLKPIREVYVLLAQDPKLPEIIKDEFKKNPVADHYSWDKLRYNKLKPEWVRAFLTKDDLNFSADQLSMSKRNKTLARIIRARGFKSNNDRDDCGHVVAKCLGGPFVDYNLYPQSYALNSGFKFFGLPNFHLWKAMEMFMVLWLRLKGNNPKVELCVRLYYNDRILVDRPSDMTFSVRFLAGEDEKEDEEDKENGRDIIHVMRHLLNTSNSSLQSPHTQVVISQTYVVLHDLCYKAAPRYQLLEALKKLRRGIPKAPVKVNNENDQIERMADLLTILHPPAGAAAKAAAGQENNQDITKAAAKEILTATLMGTLFGRPGKGFGPKKF